MASKKNNQVVSNNKSVRRRNRRNNYTPSPSQFGAVGVLTTKPFSEVYNGANPGKLSLRVVFQNTSDTTQLTMGPDASNGFPNWAPKISSILATYKYWRLGNFRLTAIVTGGASSAYYAVCGLSNDAAIDSSLIAVLDEDYAGVGNSIVPLVLQPPRSYWRQTTSPWLSTDSSFAHPDKSNGSMTIVGGGGATAGTVIGWCSVDIELEFHTMV